MSLKMMTWAFTKDLKNSQFQVLVAIANEANDAGECFTGQLKLAYLANVGERTLRNCINQFREMDLLHTERRPMSFGSGRKADTIILHFENEAHQKAPFADASSEKKEAAARRKKYESVSYGEAETTQPANIAGRNFNRQTQVVQPAKLNKVPLKSAFNRNARALTHLNPFNPSVSQSDNTSTSAASAFDQQTDWDSFLDEFEGKASTAVPAVPEPAVEPAPEHKPAQTTEKPATEKATIVKGVNLMKLRGELSTQVSMLGVDDEVLAEMVRIVCSRTSAAIRSPQRFVLKSIIGEYQEVLSLALENLDRSSEESSTEPTARPVRHCQKHQMVEYTIECSACRSERISAVEDTTELMSPEQARQWRQNRFGNRHQSPKASA